MLKLEECSECGDRGYTQNTIEGCPQLCPCRLSTREALKNESPGDVIEINSIKLHYAIAALCLVCSYRWFGLVVKDTSLFALECPSCRAQHSFASFMPDVYLESFLPTKRHP